MFIEANVNQGVQITINTFNNTTAQFLALNTTPKSKQLGCSKRDNYMGDDYLFTRCLINSLANKELRIYKLANQRRVISYIEMQPLCLY